MKKKIAIILLMIFMIPLLCYSQPQTKKPQKMSFDFVDADVRNVLKSLAEVMGKNIIIGDDVKPLKITMRLVEVSPEDAIDVILKNSDLVKQEKDNIISVITLKKNDERIKRDREEKAVLDREQENRLKQGEEIIAQPIPLKYTKAEDVVKIIRGETTSTAPQSGGAGGIPGVQPAIQHQTKGLLSEYGSVTVVPWTNTIIVKDRKENVEQIKKLITDNDYAPQQVQIEARIVQATSDFSKELGIQWGASYRAKSSALGNRTFEVGGSKDWGKSSDTTKYDAPTGMVGRRVDDTGASVFPYNVNLPAAVGTGAGGTFGLFIGSVQDSFNLDVQLSALESLGKGKIISNPKIITLDNREAEIKQGTKIPYQTVSQSGTQTQLIDAVLSLKVRPQVIRNDNTIKLEITATKDRPLPEVTAGIPIDSKLAKTELIVKDGETVVLGGIYEINEDSSDSGVPYLNKIPILGWLFKKEKKIDNKKELLIFVTPKIVENLYEK